MSQTTLKISEFITISCPEGYEFILEGTIGNDYKVWSGHKWNDIKYSVGENIVSTYRYCRPIIKRLNHVDGMTKALKGRKVFIKTLCITTEIVSVYWNPDGSAGGIYALPPKNARTTDVLSFRFSQIEFLD